MSEPAAASHGNQTVLVPDVSASSSTTPDPAASITLWPEYLVSGSPALAGLFDVALLIVIALVVLAITRGLLRPLLLWYVNRTPGKWNDILLTPSFINWMSWIPVTAVGNYGPLFLGNVDEWIVDVIRNVSRSLTLIMVLLAIGALMSGFNALYTRLPIAKSRPIKGYIQIAKILLYGMGGLVAFSLLIDESPWKFMAGLGAMTAVLLLIFRDTILSLVASITLSTNDMVRVGDWIEMPQAGADGDVIDISLHTIKVQNWDRTISTIPTYRLMSDSYKNWRGMQESGGRRIMRNLRIDTSTVRFLEDDEIEQFAKLRLLRDYIAEKKKDLAAWNETYCKGEDPATNSRRLTNLGTLRAYIINYLKSRDDIHLPGSGLMFLVRQMEADEHGAPIQIYIFTKTTVWVEYEGIQGDIFDHIFAMLPVFGLRLFQDPSGHDVRSLLRAQSTDAPPTAES
ncbi:MAG: mechanosensitive ion channel family protein [Planctomycetota bacterium]|nr:MAG: mechanosensitive ion channel family protein [Planctomycetota bacterium]